MPLSLGSRQTLIFRPAAASSPLLLESSQPDTHRAMNMTAARNRRLEGFIGSSAFRMTRVVRETCRRLNQRGNYYLETRLAGGHEWDQGSTLTWGPRLFVVTITPLTRLSLLSLTQKIA